MSGVKEVFGKRELPASASWVEKNRWWVSALGPVQYHEYKYGLVQYHEYCGVGQASFKAL